MRSHRLEKGGGVSSLGLSHFGPISTNTELEDIIRFLETGVKIDCLDYSRLGAIEPIERIDNFVTQVTFKTSQVILRLISKLLPRSFGTSSHSRLVQKRLFVRAIVTSTICAGLLRRHVYIQLLSFRFYYELGV